MHLVDVATHMQLASTGQVAACVPFLYQKKTKMTLYKGDAALETRRAVASKLTPSLITALPSGAAETVGDKLVACTSDLAELVKIFGVPMVAVERPRLEPQLWSFSEAVLYAAGTTANPN